MKLTRPTIAKLELPDGKAEYTWKDERLPGFGLRVRAGGSRTWVVHYRTGGRQRWTTIGKASELSPTEAMKAAQRVLAAVRTGVDPAAERDAARQREARTFKALAATYLSEHVEPSFKPASAHEARRYLMTDWRPLHSMPADGITRRDVAARLEELRKKGHLVAANRARSTLSAFFGWAIKRGLCEVNPVIGTAKATEERSRERVLNADEVRCLWEATEGPADYHAIVRLLLLTGQRRDEVAELRWSELDLDAGLWRLPAERSKNGRGHEVPLSAPAVALLQERPREEGRDLVFGRGAGGFSGFSRAKNRLDAAMTLLRCRAAGIAKPGKSELAEHALKSWVIHDIRRTVATSLAELGTQPHVVEAILNHVSGHKSGVAGVYNHATYSTEKRHALDMWGQHITGSGVIASPSVVPFRRA